MNANLQVNDLILLSIKRIGINGEGIGYYKRLAVFVEGALVGEEVEVIITERKAKYAIGEITKIKRNHRIELNRLINFIRVRRLHDADNDLQRTTKTKKNMLLESFKHYYRGNLTNTVFYDMIGAKEIWGYRNKTNFLFAMTVKE